ncbi:MAG: TIGR03943 family protein [Bifidobacteriaceae bacterium]|jgi:uncharacterized repeat protein (TIGR03943 family)|nr:TIGR03943 family protein [Bifidobacteriaceae bacterium]MCI1979233.1 TIGR03943 family protein [Bifidobacteriaceae bacterium]
MSSMLSASATSAASATSGAASSASKRPEQATHTHMESLWIFEFFSCLAATGGVLYLLISTQYLRFITPRMGWCLYVLLAFLLLWTVELLVRKPHLSATGLLSRCMVVLLPAMLIVVPHSAITGSSFDKFGGNTPLQIQWVADGKPVMVNTDSDIIPGLDSAKKTITIDNENFGSWYDLLQAQPTRFSGYTVTLTGFVHRVPTTLGKNQFIVSRPLMTCCIEDISAFGLVSEYAGQATLGENTWINASGKLTTTTSKVTGATTPLLKITHEKTALQVTGYFYR